MRYKHLTRVQRYTIEALLQTPMSLKEIGEVIGVSAGTVSLRFAGTATYVAIIGTDGNWPKEVRKEDEGQATLPEVH